MICPRCQRLFNAEHPSGLCSYCRPAISLKINRSVLNREKPAGRRFGDGTPGDTRYSVVVTDTDSGVNGGKREWVSATVGSQRAAVELIRMAERPIPKLNAKVVEQRTTGTA